MNSLSLFRLGAAAQKMFDMEDFFGITEVDRDNIGEVAVPVLGDLGFLNAPGDARVRSGNN